MTREEMLREWHQEALTGFLREVDALLHRPAKYIDPDFSREPTTGKPLYERVREHRQHLVTDCAGQAAHVPAMDYVFPEGIGDSLNRDELLQLRSEIEIAIRGLAEPV